MGCYKIETMAKYLLRGKLYSTFGMRKAMALPILSYMQTEV